MLRCHHTDEAPAALPGRSFVEATIGRDTLLAVSAGRDGCALFDPGRHEAGELPWLASWPDAGLDRILRRSGALDRLGERLRPVFRSHAALTLRHLARLGRGLAWLPESLVADELRAGTLAPVGGAALAVPIAIRLIRARARQNAAFEALSAAAPRA